MKLTPEQLKELLKIAISTAKKAGKLIASFSDREIEVQSKAGGSSLASQVVTEVDIKCQEIILSELDYIIKKYDLGLLTEESPDDNSRFEKDYFWCIDPLDGTLPFTQKQAGYSVAIALVSNNGTPEVGVVYDPLKQTLYSAIKGQGAFRNNELWKPKSTKHTFTFICDRSFTTYHTFEPIVTELKAFSLNHGFTKFKIISQGGAAMNAMWVLENAPACYFKFPKNGNGGGSLWDYAATACIFNEVGAGATNIHGKKLDLNRADSSYMNAQGILFTTLDLKRLMTHLFVNFNS